MSANKKGVNKKETKISEDTNTDSGFLSGPIDTFPGDEEQDSDGVSDDRSVLRDSASGKQSTELDSGIVDVSEALSDVHLFDTPVAPSNPFLCQVDAQNTLPPTAILFQPDSDGDTQLHIAAIHGCQKSVGTLIRICPNQALLDVANDDGHTALHFAVMSRNAIVTRMLVRAGAVIGLRDRLGETPLHKATLVGDNECLQALLAPVPEHPPRKLSSVLDQRNYKGQACVHIAASAGHVAVLQTLVYYGADINATENLAGWTALHIAARRGDYELARHLCECAAVETRALDYGGRSPRRLARNTPAERAFLALADDTDSDSDSEYDYDSEHESFFTQLQEKMGPINVA